MVHQLSHVNNLLNDLTIIFNLDLIKRVEYTVDIKISGFNPSN
jgi:hypothetical protein